ncbi:MAG TPA: FAD:protein FMN transferase [Candidatus Eisenbacteria bacterium]|nr:FAD:protein FMN transferase [Candidatus Eisenbacteria bacterium]
MIASVLGIVDGRALGTSMRLIVTRPEALTAAKETADRIINAIDVAASRFREDSELSRVNREAGREVRISPLLAQAIAAGLRGARLTDGAVDPTVGTAVRLAGYDRDFAALPPDGSPIGLSVARVPGWQAIQFDEGARVVLVPTGVEIDLGATAKALAADLAAAAALQAVGAGGVLVSLGGDIAVAGDPPVQGWAVQASEDSSAPIDDDAETIIIESGGIATSSTTVRQWTRGGLVLHHIIDPSTGLPVAGRWRTASVVAASCVDANIASTAAIVMGDAAIPWLAAHNLPARLVDRYGGVHRVSGWPEPNS